MKYIGYWWSDDIEKKKFGTLIKKENDFELELLDSDCIDFEFTKPYTVIHGCTKEGKHINLFDCINTGINSNLSGMISRTYKGNRIVVTRDNYYNSMEEMKIKFVYFRCDYLAEWIGKSLATLNRSGENLSEIQLNIKPFDDEIYKFDDFVLKFYFGYNTKMNNTFTDFSWKQRNGIKLEFEKEKNLTEVFEIIYNICDFLSFCIGKTVKYREIECKDINGDEINIFDSYTEGNIKSIDRWDMSRSLVIYNDINQNFETIFSNWVVNKDKLQPIISKIISCEKDTKSFIVQINFVDIVTALETFSRRFMNNYKIEQDEYKEMIETMLNSINNEEFKNKISKRLKYSNEPSLYDRLKSILEKFPEIIGLSNTKTKSLICKSVNTRNYYTHFGEDNKPEKRLTGVKAMYTYEVYKIILKLLILEELGADTNKILNRQKNVPNSNLQYIEEFQKEFNRPKS